MKKTIFFLVFILVNAIANAQYGGNGYGGNGYSRGGYGNNDSMSQLGQSQPEKPKEIAPEVTADKILEQMKPALNLDELQQIAIKNVLVESINSQGRIMKIEKPQDEKIKDFQALAEVTDRKINQFLNKDQKEKYLVFKETAKAERLNPKSKKKDKKDKKGKKEPQDKPEIPENK